MILLLYLHANEDFLLILFCGKGIRFSTGTSVSILIEQLEISNKDHFDLISNN